MACSSRSATSGSSAPSMPLSPSRLAAAADAWQCKWALAGASASSVGATPPVCACFCVGLRRPANKMPSPGRPSSRGGLGLRDPGRACPTPTVRRPAARTSESASSDAGAALPAAPRQVVGMDLKWRFSGGGLSATVSAGLPLASSSAPFDPWASSPLRAPRHMQADDLRSAGSARVGCGELARGRVAAAAAAAVAGPCQPCQPCQPWASPSQAVRRGT